MQVDPIKPALKAPGTKRLELQYDVPLSEFAFKFNLRLFDKDKLIVSTFLTFSILLKVGRCKLTL